MTRKQRGLNINQGRVGSSGYNGITSGYQVACMISLLVLACMIYACVYLVLLLSLACVSPSVTMLSTFPFHFWIAMVWCGSFIWLCYIIGWFWSWVRWSQEKSQGPRNPLTSNSGIHSKSWGWRWENSSRYRWKHIEASILV